MRAILGGFWLALLLTLLLTDPIKGQPTVMVDSIIDLGATYIGKPYRYKVVGYGSLDCSGFLRHIHGCYGIDLPPSSQAMASSVESMPLDKVEPGDLLFFKGRDAKSNRVGHVAMVVQANADGIRMMHSCSRGIRYDNLSDVDYYRERFLMAGRILRSDALVEASVEVGDPIVGNDSVDLGRLRIIGVGDIMLGTNYPSASYLPPNDGKELLAPVAEVLRDADITFGNLEGVLLNGEGTIKKCSDPSICYAFRSPEHYAQHIVDAGFDVVSIANNHVGDFGEMGRLHTVQALQRHGLEFAGLLSYPYTLFERDSVRYGFCAFAPNTGTVRLNDVQNAVAIVQHLDSLADVVIVSFHGGAEGKSYRHITRATELYLGEDRGDPYAFSRAVIDAGADIVFGHGPHVTRGIDLYKDRFIAYSLGNFATYARFNLSGPNGLAPIIRVHTDKKGRFIEAEIISIKQEGEGGPVLDAENGALLEIIELTKEDIPQAPLSIGMDGTVRRREDGTID
ncbi:MAG: CapA family protein [Flavobacteriales bacterium]